MITMANKTATGIRAVSSTVRWFWQHIAPPPSSPPIPYGKIIAKPTSDGKYRLFVYRGRMSGWVPEGTAECKEDAQRAMQNLMRPILVAETQTESEAK